MDKNQQKIQELEQKIKKLEDFCFTQNMQFQTAVWDNVLLKLEMGLGIGIGKILSKDSPALIELSSTTKGFIFPQLTTTQISLIKNPKKGLVVFNNTTNVLNFYNGSSWIAI